MWMQLVLCVSSMQSELLVSVVRFASTRRRQASSMVKYRKFHRKRQRRSILVRHTVRQTGYCLIRCMSSTNFTLKLDLPPNVVVVECIYEPHVFSHSVGTSSAECICCSCLSSLDCMQPNNHLASMGNRMASYTVCLPMEGWPS